MHCPIHPATGVSAFGLVAELVQILSLTVTASSQHFSAPAQVVIQAKANSTRRPLTCSSSFQPSSFRRWQLLMLIIAAVATSAALP